MSLEACACLGGSDGPSGGGVKNACGNYVNGVVARAAGTGFMQGVIHPMTPEMALTTTWAAATQLRPMPALGAPELGFSASLFWVPATGGNNTHTRIIGDNQIDPDDLASEVPESTGVSEILTPGTREVAISAPALRVLPNPPSEIVAKAAAVRQAQPTQITDFGIPRRRYRLQGPKDTNAARCNPGSARFEDIRGS